MKAEKVEHLMLTEDDVYRVLEADVSTVVDTSIEVAARR